MLSVAEICGIKKKYGNIKDDFLQSIWINYPITEEDLEE